MFKFNEVAGFYPVQKQGTGDGTVVVLNNGQEFFQAKTVKSFRREFLKYYFVDYQALRVMAKNFGEPIPLVAGTKIFVPLKFRKRNLPGDFCYAYFSLEQIKFCGGREKGLLILNCGQSYYLACSGKTALAALNRAKVLRLELSLRF